MQIKIVNKLISLGLIGLALFACKKPKPTDVEIRKGASLDAEAGFNESAYSNEQRLLDPVYGSYVSGPPSPSIFT